MNSRKTTKAHPNVQDMGVFRELFGGIILRYIGSALYFVTSKSNTDPFVYNIESCYKGT